MTLLVAIAAFALVLGGGGCAGESRPEVVVYVSVDQPTAAPVLAAFEETAGIRVLATYDVESSKTTGLVHRLESERDRPVADVFWSSEVIQTAWLGDQGVLQAYPPSTADGVPAGFRAPDHGWTGMGLRARVLLVNTERVGPEQRPQGLDDLLAPRWEPGDVALALPLFGTSATAAAALYDARGPEAARSWYEAARDRGAQVMDGNASVRDRVASGDAAVGLTDSDDALGAQRAGAPVAVVVPRSAAEGGLLVPATVALIAGAPHPEQGRALVDWLVGGDAEALLIEDGFFTGSVRDAPDEAGVDWNGVAGWLPQVRTEMREVFLR